MEPIIELPREIREISFRPDYPFGVKHEDYLFEMKESVGVNPYRGYIIGRYNFRRGNVAFVTAEKLGRIITETVYVVPLSGIFTENLSPELKEEVYRLYGKDGERVDRVLEDAGFERSLEMYVPHLKNADEWGKSIVENARVLSMIEKRMILRKLYSSLGMEPKVKLSDDIAKYFRPAWDWPSEKDMLKSAGKYNASRTILVVYDEYGIPYVGIKKEGLEEELERVGFEKNEEIYIPHLKKSDDKWIEYDEWVEYMFSKREEDEINYAAINTLKVGNLKNHNRRILDALERRGFEVTNLDGLLLE